MNINAGNDSFTVLVAEDEEDGGNFMRGRWEKSRAFEELRFVEDGEELTQYLQIETVNLSPKHIGV